MLFRKDASRSLGVQAAGLALVAGYLVAEAQEASSAASVVGTPQVGATGVRERTAQIMTGDRWREARHEARHVVTRFVLCTAGAAVSTNNLAVSPAPTGLSSLNAQTVSATVNFTEATFSNYSGWPRITAVGFSGRRIMSV
jgi:hypothetical protein